MLLSLARDSHTHALPQLLCLPLLALALCFRFRLTLRFRLRCFLPPALLRPMAGAEPGIPAAAAVPAFPDVVPDHGSAEGTTATTCSALQAVIRMGCLCGKVAGPLGSMK